MIQPYFFIVVKKQWKQHLAFICILLISLIAIWGVYKTLNKSFQIPVAVQDLDQSEASKSLIKSITSNEYITKIEVPAEETYLDEYIERKEAIVSLQIPKNYSQQLHDNRLKETILLYGRDDFIGDITLEIISMSLYEQQIPNIVKSHLDDNGDRTSLTRVNKILDDKTPQSQIAHYFVKSHSETSISLSVIFAILLCISSVQIILHQRLKQNGPLIRIFLVQFSQLRLYVTYILIHAILLLMTLIISALLFHQSLSWIFYLKSLFIIVLFEAGVAYLLFKINTLSHRLFMTFIYALVMSVIYVFIQI
ncbi:ABC transporter permease [Staphylococcus cohnii]|uniref:ABC transporter permease n=1 Tax=Staphylococcus TaxID=1279 RepID=UPI000E68100C|nr:MULTISPECIES: ABC transporter permease [Staphylococcus]MBA1353651.1 ABC transporter permease [Staphylococcus cohnii]MBA1390024.1 ABC transporter permease [Staphylococcus cohnii]MCE5099108.1 ABC transporter permease [Staphylococcus cohnii]MSU29982.1 ABC transporter permease [Staphylococcus sp. McC-251-APC-3A2]RIL88804.1 ABC transporter permease [Staphylococcus cohnii]